MRLKSFKPVERALDAPAHLRALEKLNGCFLLLRFWNDWLVPLIQFLTQFALLALSPRHLFRRLDPADQAFCDRTVVRLASGQQNGDQPPLASASGVYLRVGALHAKRPTACFCSPLFRPLPSDAL